MSDDIFNELIESTDISLQQILNNLLDGSQNLDLKTQIVKPKQLASLNVLSDLLKEMKFKDSSKMLKDFIEIYLRYMVSYERQSRKEIIRAVSSLLERENKDLVQKLTKNMK